MRKGAGRRYNRRVLPDSLPVLALVLNNGLQSLISRRAGENRIEEIGKIFSQGVMISVVVSALGYPAHLYTGACYFPLYHPLAGNL